MGRHIYGYTLFEMLGTLTILSILVSMSWPLNHPKDNHLEQTSKNIEVLINKAASQAFYSGETYGIEFKEQAIFLSKNKTRTKIYTIPAGIKVTTGKVNVIYFSKSGVTSPAQISLSFKKQHCHIKLALFGRINSTCARTLFTK